MNLFTQGQSDRMNALFAPGGIRESLLSSGGCGSGNPGPNCNDGVQNGNETGVDCGGDCAPCQPTANCNDGIQNGNETGVDCGGSCAPCQPTATCSDGIQNGNETGVDCGGSCSACPPVGGSCEAPSGLYSQSKKGGKEAELTWDAVGSATSYEIRIREVGAGSWNTASSSSSNIRATGLSRNNSYEWEVRAICGNETSDWSSSSFVAGQSGRALVASWEVYPNPAADFTSIEFLGEWNEVDVFVTDVSGKLVYKANNFMADQNSYLEIPVHDLSNGMYFINVRNLSGEIQIEKLIISK